MSTQTLTAKGLVLALLLPAIAQRAGAAADPRRLAEATDLHSVAKRFELSRPQVAGDTAVLKASGKKLTFRANSRKLDFNGTLIWLNAPTMISQRRWILSDHDTEHIVSPLLRPRFHLPPAETPLVVLDPGHGGADSGAIGPGRLFEKSVTLDICRRITRHLERAGIRCALTRTSDVALALQDRSRIAAELGATVFVSVHANSSSNPRSTGFETYIASAAGYPSTAHGSRPGKASAGNHFDAANLLLAYAVHSAVLPATGTVDRGIRHARFAVLREASCPSVLIEVGFISNPDEEMRLRTNAYRESLAAAVAEGLDRHFQQRTYLPVPHLVAPSSTTQSPARPTKPKGAPPHNLQTSHDLRHTLPQPVAIEPTRPKARR